jgi:hypothetical protein
MARPRLRSRIALLGPTATFERLSERREVRRARRLLDAARAGATACYLPTDEPEPLVSVCIPTNLRDPALLHRAVGAALAQSYPRIEVLVVSDVGESRIAPVKRAISDARVRFVDVEPSPPLQSGRNVYRRFSGSYAKRNVALELAEGSWIAPSDDDDEMATDHVESLLRAARACQAELVYSQARMERAPGDWFVAGHAPLERRGVVHGTVLYSAALRFVQYRRTAWKVREFDDWNFLRRMQRIGVRIQFLEQVTYTHYLEGPQRAAEGRSW